MVKILVKGCALAWIALFAKGAAVGFGGLCQEWAHHMAAGMLH
jgi:hypothetical protein